MKLRHAVAGTAITLLTAFGGVAVAAPAYAASPSPDQQMLIHKRELAKYRLVGSQVSTTSGTKIDVFNVAYRFDSPNRSTRSAGFDVTVTN